MPTQSDLTSALRFFKRIQDTDKPKEVISVFSLDYDNHGDICFESALIEKHFAKPNYLSFRQRFLESVRAVFHDYFAMNSRDVTELYVGSNRQCAQNDMFNGQKNKNGSCFRNFEALAVMKGWAFHTLLLGDTHTISGLWRPRPYPRGQAMRDLGILCHHDERKIKILTLQLRDIATRYPDKDIQFYFSDDDKKDIIFPALLEYFSSAEGSQSIPHNVTLHLTKFDWRKSYHDFKKQWQLSKHGSDEEPPSRPLPEQEELKEWIKINHMIKICQLQRPEIDDPRVKIEYCL